MRIHATQPLFAWSELEDSPSLKTIRAVLASLPDQPVLDALQQARGHGRDDYPLERLWGVVVLSVLCRHVWLNDCLAELGRNPALCRLLGIRKVADIPGPHNLSRFLDLLGRPEPLRALRGVFDALVADLGRVVPDLGRHTAGDSTALKGKAKRDPQAVQQEIAEGLPQPSGGKKEYQDEDGRVVQVYEWFGYKLHLLVDAQHEVAVAYHVSDTKLGDNEGIAPLIEQAEANLGEGRIETLAYDKAADDSQVHELLHEHQIKPVIQVRQLWKEEQERPLRVGLPVVYDEAGTVFCYDTVSDPPVRKQMACIGYEKGRETVKYRCPARHDDLPCPSLDKCNTGKRYGLTVRIKCTEDLRRFPPLGRATKQFERRYKGRTAVERVNGRLKVFWGVDDGNVSGARRFHAHVGVVLVVHLALARWLASQPRWEGGPLGQMTLSPIAQALARLDQENAQEPALEGNAT
ncbi:MAG: transposase [Actinomycetes bacterium]